MNHQRRRRHSQGRWVLAQRDKQKQTKTTAVSHHPWKKTSPTKKRYGKLHHPHKESVVWRIVLRFFPSTVATANHKRGDRLLQYSTNNKPCGGRGRPSTEQYILLHRSATLLGLSPTPSKIEGRGKYSGVRAPAGNSYKRIQRNDHVGDRTRWNP